MSTYLDKKDQASKDIEAVADELIYISKAFSVTGNTTMASELLMMASFLKEARGKFEQAFNDLFNSYHNSTVESSANMVKAALAVAMHKGEGDKNV